MTDAKKPRPAFKVAGLAGIKHLNVRKEGPEDERVLAVDVKLEFKGVDRRLCAYFDEALEPFLWRGNTDALIQRNSFMAPVVYMHEITGATVQIAAERYHGCDVKKFSIAPRDSGVFDLTCSVSLYPSSSDVSALAKLVQEDASASIEGPPDLFDAPPAGTAGEAAGRMDDLLRESGGSAELIGPGGEKLMTFGEGEDPFYEQAVTLVFEQGKASISLVQRHLKIGYNRAARLLEQMEKNGRISPMDATGARNLITD